MNPHEYDEEGDLTGKAEKEPLKIVFYPFDRYLITVRLTQKNEFVDIVEIKINKDFLEGTIRLSAIPSMETIPE